MTNTLSLVYFPAAVALGALHALEPGHAKALTASYLIGIKGTKRDSIILGLSVAATHSLVVIGISAIGLWLGREAFAGEATKWLEMASGLVAIAIGSWMMWRRLFKAQKPQEHHHHAPNPALFQGKYLQGTLEIIDTPIGEKMRFVSINVLISDKLTVEIDRSNSEIEKLSLIRSPEDKNLFLSIETPGEPHEFSARLVLNMAV